MTGAFRVPTEHDRAIEKALADREALIRNIAHLGSELLSFRTAIHKTFSQITLDEIIELKCTTNGVAFARCGECTTCKLLNMWGEIGRALGEDVYRE